MERGKKSGKALYLIGLALATCRWGRRVEFPPRRVAPRRPRRHNPRPATTFRTTRTIERAHHERSPRKNRHPARPERRLFRPLARLLHRRPGRRAALPRLFDPRSRPALDFRGNLLPAAEGRAADARPARR